MRAIGERAIVAPEREPRAGRRADAGDAAFEEREVSAGRHANLGAVIRAGLAGNHFGPCELRRGREVGYVLYESKLRTLQTSFDVSFPEFQIMGRDFHSIGFNTWALVEGQLSNDSTLRAGEQVFLVDYSTTSGDYDPEAILTVTYEGMVDLDLDGWLDSIVVSESLNEFVLTNLDPFIDFQPFSTEVTLNKVSFGITPGSIIEEPQPNYRVVNGSGRNDDIVGWNVDEIIFGYRGNDRVNARGGDDLVDGGIGDDLIIGGLGNDSIWGGRGRDVLRGGRGADDFWFDSSQRFDIVQGFGRNDTLIFDTVEGGYRGISFDEISIINRAQADSLYVGDDLVAQVYGSDLSYDDILLV